MGEDLKNRREFLAKIRKWLVGGLYALIPLNLIGRGGGKHILEIDTERGPRPVQGTVHCNCTANTAITEPAKIFCHNRSCIPTITNTVSKRALVWNRAASTTVAMRVTVVRFSQNDSANRKTPAAMA